jgi:GNAT superfamily N-acetyltransferase
MEIVYREQKNFSPQQLGELFRSVGWESARFPNRLAAGMRASSTVISAWDGETLVGLVRALDDGATVAFLHYLLVRPQYQKFHIGGELMRRVMEKYKDFLYVKIMPSDPAVIPFYEKFGFARYDRYSAMVRVNLENAADAAPGEGHGIC